MANSGHIRTWRHERVAYIQLHRPEKANAYNQTLLDEFTAALRQMESDRDVRVLVVCGAGDRSFCAGADLDEMKGKDYRFALDLQSAKVFTALARCRNVTFAAINGAALAGGLELALACDIRIASENARFAFPEPGLGLIPAAGGTRRLPKLLGVARAKELILGGRVWGADDARHFGLVSEVLKPEDLLPRAQQWGEDISKMDPLALELAKQAIDHDASHAPECGFDVVAEALLYQLKFGGRAR